INTSKLKFSTLWNNTYAKLKDISKKIRKRIINCKREKDRKAIREYIINKNPKPLFRRLFKESLNPRLHSLIDEKDNIVNSDTELVKTLINDWRKYYTEKENKINQNYFSSFIWNSQLFEDIPNNIDWNQLFTPITLQELKSTIKELRSSSSPGLSQISYKHMKSWPDELLSYITKSFNSILN